MKKLEETNIHNYAQTTWDNAEHHRKASVIGQPLNYDDKNICECCGQTTHKQNIDMQIHIKELQIFGFGYPLYFSFLKYCILLVFVLIASRTGTSIYMATRENYNFCIKDIPLQPHGKQHHQTANVQHQQEYLSFRHYNDFNDKSTNQELNQNLVSKNFKQSQQTKIQKNHFEEEEQNKQVQSGQQDHEHHEHKIECTSYLIYVSIFKGEDEYDNIFLRVLGFIIHLVALIGIKNMLMKQQQYYDQRTCSLSDYSIMVSNLPQVYGVSRMVRNFFQEEFNKKGQVKQIIMFILKHDKTLEKQQDQLKQYQQQLIKAVNSKDNNKFQEMKKKIIAIQQDLDGKYHALKGDIHRDYVHCQKLIVVMNTQQDKDDILNEFKSNESSKKQEYLKYFNSPALQKDKKHYVQLSQAPQPNQIIWEHMNVQSLTRHGLIIRSWIFTFIFLALTTGIFYLFLRWKTNFVEAIQEQNHDDPHAKHIVTFIVFVALFIVILFNKFIMSLVLHKFVHMQKHAYTDKQGFSFAMKYSLGMFFTTAVMTLLVQGITFNNFYTHSYGVIEQQSIMFFVTAFFIPLVWLIHPYRLHKKLKLHIHKDTPVTQQQANELIEDFEYDLGKRYAQIFEIMWFTFLYSELIPMGSFLILIGLVLYYWVDKYNFLRRSAVKEGHSGKISTFSLQALDATLFLAHAGRVMFTYLVQHHEIDYLGIIFTIIGIAYLFLPIEQLIKILNKEEFKAQQKTYDQAKYSFKDHYFTLHPVYKKTHRKQIRLHKQKVLKHYQKVHQQKKQKQQKKEQFKSLRSIKNDNTSVNDTRSVSAGGGSRIII